MSFGRNPHVPKAEAAEQKAQTARDAAAHEQAWREAARLWERAAERETDAKRRQQYSDRAEAARTQADAGPDDAGPGNDADNAPEERADHDGTASKLLN